MPPTDDKRTLVATRAGVILPPILGGLDLTYQGRQLGDARKDLPNVWGDINTFKGIRFTPKKLIAGGGEDGTNYNLGPLDYEISIDASLSDFTFFLPFALGNGQEFKVKRLDDSSNVVSVVARPGELIDGDDTVFLSAQYDFMPLSDAGDGVWNKQGSIGSIIPSDIARLSLPNHFLSVNTFTGIRITPKTIRSSLVTGYDITELDYEIIANCDAGPLTFYLPFATGNGQICRVKKIDENDDIVTIIAKDGDLIDDSISVNLIDQWAECQVQDADANYWDNQGQSSSGGAGTSPPVIEIPVGDMNGGNTNFSTSQDFVTLAVYLNGLRLLVGPTKDYIITGANSFTMNDAPQADDSLQVEFFTGEPGAEVPPSDSQGVRYITNPGPPITVSLQIKNSSNIWETIWTESAST